MIIVAEAWYRAFTKYPLYSETEQTIQRRDAYVEGYIQGTSDMREDLADKACKMLEEAFIYAKLNKPTIESTLKLFRQELLQKSES